VPQAYALNRARRDPRAWTIGRLQRPGWTAEPWSPADLHQVQAVAGTIAAMAAHPDSPTHLHARMLAAMRRRASAEQIGWWERPGEATSADAPRAAFTLRLKLLEGAPNVVITPALCSPTHSLSGEIRVHRLGQPTAQAVMEAQERSVVIADLAALIEATAVLRSDPRDLADAPRLLAQAIDALHPLRDAAALDAVGAWWRAAEGEWVDAARLRLPLAAGEPLATAGVELRLDGSETWVRPGLGDLRPPVASLAPDPGAPDDLHALATRWLELTGRPDGPWSDAQRRRLEAGWQDVHALCVFAAAGGDRSWRGQPAAWSDGVRGLVGVVVESAQAVCPANPTHTGMREALDAMWRGLRALCGPPGRALPEAMFLPAAGTVPADRLRHHVPEIGAGWLRLVEVSFAEDPAGFSLDVGDLPPSVLRQAAICERLEVLWEAGLPLAAGAEARWAGPLRTGHEAERERCTRLLARRAERRVAQPGLAGLLELAVWTEELSEAPPPGPVERVLWDPRQLPEGFRGRCAGLTRGERVAIEPDGRARRLKLAPAEGPLPIEDSVRACLAPEDDMWLCSMLLGGRDPAEVLRELLTWSGVPRQQVLDALCKLLPGPWAAALGLSPVVEGDHEEPGQVVDGAVSLVPDRDVREQVPANSFTYGDRRGLRIGGGAELPARPAHGPRLRDGALLLAHEVWRARPDDPHPAAEALRGLWCESSRVGLDDLALATPLTDGERSALRAVLDAEGPEWGSLRERYLREDHGWVLVSADTAPVETTLFWPLVQPDTIPQRWPGLRRAGATTAEILPRERRAPLHPPPADLVAAIAVRDAVDRAVPGWQDADAEVRSPELSQLREVIARIVTAVPPERFDEPHVDARAAPRAVLLLLRALDAAMAAVELGDLEVAGELAGTLAALDGEAMLGLGIQVSWSAALTPPDRAAIVAGEGNGGWVAVTAPAGRVMARAWMHDVPIHLPALAFQRSTALTQPPPNQPARFVYPRTACGAPPWVERLGQRLLPPLQALPWRGETRAARAAVHGLVELPVPASIIAARLARLVDDLDACEAAVPGTGVREIAAEICGVLHEVFAWSDMNLQPGQPAPRGSWNRHTSCVPAGHRDDAPIIERVLERAYHTREGVVRPGRIEVRA
jgi:hypothetical protein